MKKEFVRHEISLERKQLGFDDPCIGKFYYNQLEIGGIWTNNDFKEDPDIFISAPLYRQVFTWFREKYSLIGEIFSQLRPSNNFMYGFKIGGSDIIFDGFQTYEEAELACLLKLIETVKESI